MVVSGKGREGVKYFFDCVEKELDYLHLQVWSPQFGNNNCQSAILNYIDFYTKPVLVRA